MNDPDKKWTFWDALTNANPDWWDSDDDEDEEEDEPDDDED
jgi:hypothetical protein